MILVRKTCANSLDLLIRITMDALVTKNLKKWLMQQTFRKLLKKQMRFWKVVRTSHLQSRLKTYKFLNQKCSLLRASSSLRNKVASLVILNLWKKKRVVLHWKQTIEKLYFNILFLKQLQTSSVWYERFSTVF